MIWALLAMVGVPLWLCAIGIFALVLPEQVPAATARRHPGPGAARGKTRWIRGHAVWVSDVFAWRGSPAAWQEDLVQVTGSQRGGPGAGGAEEAAPVGRRARPSPP